MEDKVTRREPAYFDPHSFRRKMVEAGITQCDLADACGIDQRNISAILVGKQYLGRSRRDRLQHALHQLAAEAETKKRAETTEQEEASTPSEHPAESPEESPAESSARKSEPKPQATMRIRRL